MQSFNTEMAFLNQLNLVEGMKRPVLLLALALLVTQTLTIQHVHADEAPSDACVLCIHGDAPAAVDEDAPAAAPHHCEPPLPAVQATSALSTTTYAYRTRAPPGA